MLGIAFPEKSLRDFINSNEDELEDTLLETQFPNLKLLSSASDLMSVVMPNYREKQRLFNALGKLDSEYILFDIAAGANRRAIDFFTMAPMGIIILQPLPTAVENAFAFLKNLLMRHLLRTFYHNTEMNQFVQDATDTQKTKKPVEFNNLLEMLQDKAPGEIIKFKREIYSKNYRLYIVANSIENKMQEQVAEKFISIVKKFLLFDMAILGKLPFDPFMDNAIVSRTPFILKYPDSDYTIENLRVVKRIFSIFNERE